MQTCMIERINARDFVTWGHVSNAEEFYPPPFLICGKAANCWFNTDNISMEPIPQAAEGVA